MNNQSAHKKLFIKTYGCQMNVYDSARMADIMAPLGYIQSDSPDDADLVILNTCHIREKAEEKVYSDLGRIRENKKRKESAGEKMLIAVGGCVGQAEGEEIINRARYVDIVLGPQSYHRLPEMVTKAIRQGGGVVDLEFPAISKFDALPEVGKAEGASAFLSVQEGCDKFCTFCVVPYTRGAEYSRPAADVLREAHKLVELGVSEINLLGQNVNAYHGIHNGQEIGLSQLIRMIAKIDGVKRILYTTSHPRDMDDDLIRAHGEVEELLPYLHLPIQSGSDNVLKRMNRKHDVLFYLDIIDKLRVARPDIAFSSDFIVGFPGETDKDFAATMRLVETVGYAQAYSFKYSPRPGTPASNDDLQVEEDVKTERLALLQGLINRQQNAFNRASIGQEMTVLFEKTGKYEGQLIGKSPYMQSVHVRDAAQMMHRYGRVRITEAHANSVAGELIEIDNSIKKCA